MLTQSFKFLIIQLKVIFIDKAVQFVCAKDFSNLLQLINARNPEEKWFLSEDHGCKHSPEAPHIYAEVVSFVVEKKLWCLPKAYTNIQIFVGSVEIC
jgi:hypothetical protein